MTTLLKWLFQRRKSPAIGYQLSTCILIPTRECTGERRHSSIYQVHLRYLQYGQDKELRKRNADRLIAWKHKMRFQGL